MFERLMTYSEVAEILAVPLKRVEELGRRGVLPTVKLGRQRRVARDALRSFIQAGGFGLPGGWKVRPD